MKQLRTLGLVAGALLSFNIYAEDAYTYRQEFESFRQSAEFNELIKNFVEFVTHESPENFDAAQRSTMLRTLSEIDFIIASPESLPVINDFVDRMCNTNQMERPLVVVMNRSLSLGDAIANQYEQNNVLIIEKDLLVESTDKEIETTLLDKLNKLKLEEDVTTASAENEAVN